MTYAQPMPRPKPARETWLAYVLWILLGQFGAHKFYLEQTGMGIIYLLLGLIGWATSWIFIGYFLLVPLWIMMFIDLFTMPSRIRRVNRGYRGY